MQYKSIFNYLVILFITMPVISYSQLGGANNGNPPNIKWKELSNESARIIFPEGLDSKAARVADMIDYLNKNNRTSIGKAKGRIDIILQNQLTEANGFVTAAPFRSEFFTTAPQRSFLGTQDWLDMLSIHEYRHVMQLQFAKQGITKVGSILFGETGWIAMAFMAIPFWFTEGDAVTQETLLSGGGRGRSGSFMAEYRAMHEAGIKYPYEKIRNQSYKSILPDRYRMGYLFSIYGRNKYGNDFWKKVSKDAVRYKGVFWPFSHSLKKRTGKNVHKFYKMMMDSVYNQWDKDNQVLNWRNENEILVNKPIPKNKISYYLNPKFVDKNIIVLHSGRDRIPGFYILDKEGNEKKLFDLGYHDSYFNYNKGKMVWTQSKTDIRWKNKTFSELYIYDFKTKSKKKLTSKTKYFSPDINSEGTKILLVNSDELMRYSIEILDSKTGKIIKSIPNPDNIFLSSPKWLSDDEIIAIAQHNQKNALMRIEIQTGKMNPLIDYTQNLILRPVVNKNYVFFSGDFTDVRNIFAVDLSTKNIFQVTNSRVLASHPDVSKDGKYLLYVEQQIRGYDIKKIELNKENWRPVTVEEPIDRYKGLAKLINAEGGNILNKIPKHNYTVKDYSHIKDAINFHSWFPTVKSLNNDSGYGISFHSTNLLSTLDLSITPAINVNGDKKIGTRITWNKYFPKLHLGYDIASIQYEKDRKYTQLLQNYYFTGIEIPLNFSKDAINRGLNFGINAGFQKYNSLEKGNFRKPEDYFVLSSTINFFNERVKAYKQLNPRFGQELSIQFKGKNNEISLNNNYSVSLDGKFFFPGISRTHTLVLSGHIHNDNSKFYSIYSGNWIRGVTNLDFKTNRVMRVEYGFPITYPDIAIGPLAFIKRIRANMFFDYGFEDRRVNTISSLGVDLVSDMGIFNFGSVFTLPLGVRLSYINRGANKEFNIQLLLFQTAL